MACLEKAATVYYFGIRDSVITPKVDIHQLSSGCAQHLIEVDIERLRDIAPADDKVFFDYVVAQHRD